MHYRNTCSSFVVGARNRVLSAKFAEFLSFKLKPVRHRLPTTCPKGLQGLAGGFELTS